jgi:hypothetical protein
MEKSPYGRNGFSLDLPKKNRLVFSIWQYIKEARNYDLTISFNQIASKYRTNLNL